MSALNELIEDYEEYLDGPNDPYLNGWRAGYASALQAVAKALPDHDAEIRDIYRRHTEAALEEAVKGAHVVAEQAGEVLRDNKGTVRMTLEQLLSLWLAAAIKQVTK